MVLEVAADCRKIELCTYASGVKHTFRSDAAELQDLRREDGTGGEDDFLLRVEDDVLLIVSVECFHAHGCEVFVEDDFRHLMLSEKFQICTIRNAIVVGV